MTETKTRTITGVEVLDLLRNARDRRGAEYVYPRAAGGSKKGECVYVEQHGRGDTWYPSCMVGNVLVNDLKIDPSWFIENALNDSAAYDVVEMLPVTGVRLTRLAAHLIETAQDVQDSGKTWGQAVERAEKELALYERIGTQYKTDAEEAFAESLDDCAYDEEFDG